MVRRWSDPGKRGVFSACRVSARRFGRFPRLKTSARRAPPSRHGGRQTADRVNQPVAPAVAAVWLDEALVDQAAEPGTVEPRARQPSAAAIEDPALSCRDLTQAGASRRAPASPGRPPIGRRRVSASSDRSRLHRQQPFPSGNGDMQKAHSPSARGGGLPGEQRGTIASKAIGHTGRPMTPTLATWIAAEAGKPVVRPGSRDRPPGCGYIDPCELRETER